MKKAARLVTVLVLAALLAACGKVETLQPETTKEEVTTETTIPTEETTAATTEETTEPTVSVNEALSNVWDIMDNECVEEIPILPGLLLDDIKDWMKETEFTEIKLYQRTYWNTLRLGTYGDMAVARISMLEGDNFTGEELAWNVRMEKSDKLENKTAIEIPEDAYTGEYALLRKKTDEEVLVHYYQWFSSGDPEDKSQPVYGSELYLIYFEDTQNLYTIYSNELYWKWNGKQWESNSNRGPTVILNYIQADGNHYHDYINGDEIKAGVRDVRYFRIKMAGEGKKTYQYRFGMTMGQWVRSEYNTDGWKFDSKDPYIVTSADGRYKLSKNDYCWREMTAQLHGPIPTTPAGG